MLQRLHSGIRSHQSLVQSVGTDVESMDLASEPVYDDSAEVQEQLNRQLRLIAADMRQKRDRSISVVETGSVVSSVELEAPESAMRASLDLQSAMSQLSGAVARQGGQQERLHRQRKYQMAVQRVAESLDGIEARLLSQADSEVDTKILLEDLARVRESQQRLKSMAPSVADELELDEADLMTQSIEDLDSHIDLLRQEAEARDERAQTDRREWRSCRAEVGEAKAQLDATRRQYEASRDSRASVDQQMRESQALEDTMRQYEAKLTELAARSERLLNRVPRMPAELPADVQGLRVDWEELRLKVTERRQQLHSVRSSQAQYEKMLYSLAEYLETAETKLAEIRLVASDASDVNSQLQQHRTFFDDLETHKITLDQARLRLDQQTAAPHAQLHSRLQTLCGVVQQKAAQKAREIEAVVHDWADFQSRFAQFSAWVSSISAQVPPTGTSAQAASPAELEEKQTTLKSAVLSMREQRSGMFQLVERGRDLLRRVNCVRLEEEITEFAEHWMQLADSAEERLRHLEALLLLLKQFETDSNSLKQWLGNAHSKLDSLEQVEEAGTLSAVRLRADQLNYLEKESESRQQLRRRLADAVNAMSGAQYHSQSCESLDQLESSWHRAKQRMQELHHRLQRSFQELLPSHEALEQLSDWSSELATAVSDASAMQMLTREELTDLVEKFRGFKVDLASKSSALAFVRQSADKFDQADSAKLAELNSTWERTSAEVLANGRHLEALHSRWSEFDKRVEAERRQLAETSLKLKNLGEIGHESSVKFAIRECDSVQSELSGSEERLRSLQEDSGQLSMSPQASGHRLRQPLTELSSQLSQANSQFEHIKARLTNALAQWEMQRKAHLQVTHLLAECEYLLERHSLASGDLATFVPAIDRLVGLRDQLASGSELQELRRTTEILRRLCNQVVSKSLSNSLADLETRWMRDRQAVEARTGSLADVVDKWKAYSDFYADCQNWLDGSERRVAELLDSEIPADDTVLISQCKVEQSDLDAFDARLKKLNRLSDCLAKSMDTATLGSLASGQTLLAQRQRSLKSMLHKFVQEAGRASTRHRHCRDMRHAVDAFLDTVEADLQLPDPASVEGATEDIRGRLCELLGLADMFAQRQYQLTRLAELDEDPDTLRQVTQRWQTNLAQCLDRAKSLQATLTLQETFIDKCNDWHRFLDKAEADLATEAAGNEVALQRQQATFESFLRSLVTRQLVLDSLLAEAKEALKFCADADQRAGLSEKLETLQRQWETVVRQARQRKSLIDANLAGWRDYAGLRDRLLCWLADLEDRLALCNFSVASVQKIRILTEQIRVYQRDLQQQESFYTKCREQAQLLTEMSDAGASEKLRSQLTDLDAKWLHAVGGLEKQKERMEGFVRLWTDLDEGVQDCLKWLKEVRQFAQCEMPNAYDELQAASNQCRDYLKTFESTGGERTRLRKLEKRLCEVIGADDIMLMRQRLLLLDKQWDELHHRLKLKEEQVKHNMNEWRDFNDKYKRVNDWMAGMESKLQVNHDYQVEDLVDKIEHDYKAEMQSMQVPYNELVECGLQLLQHSSTVRSQDIEFKLERAAERWKALENMADSRLERLKETLASVRELETSMKKLRSWLSVTERQLDATGIFRGCDFGEIQRLMRSHQRLQAEIESRTSGVQAVASLCELLVYERDACPSEQEKRAVQRAVRSLELRWRHICQLAMERRLEIEDAWRSWQWIKATSRQLEEALASLEAELDASGGQSDQLDADACEELGLRLSGLTKELSSLNEEYNQLARLGRTDGLGLLRQQLDLLNRRHAGIARRLQAAAQRRQRSRALADSVRPLRQQLQRGLEELAVLENRAEGDEQWRVLREQLEAQLRKLDYIDGAGRFLAFSAESPDTDAFEQELRQCSEENARLLRQLRSVAGDERRLSGDGATVDDLDNLGYDCDDDDDDRLRSEDDEFPTPSRRFIADELGDEFDDDDSVLSDETDDLVLARPSDGRAYRHHVAAAVADAPDAKLERVERLVDELERLLEDAENDLDFGEERLRLPPPEDAGEDAYADQLPVTRTRLFSDCSDKVERIRRLEMRIRSEAAISCALGRHSRVNRVLHRWQRLQAEAAQKDARILAMGGSAGRLATDAESQAAWLSGLLRRLRSEPTPEDADLGDIESAAFGLKELIGQLESRKAAVMSLQMCQDREDLTELQRSTLSDCVSVWRAVYAEARRRHLRLQTEFANCRQLADRLAEIVQGVAEARQLSLDCQPRLSDQTADLASKEATLMSAEERVSAAAEQVRKWAQYAAVVAGCGAQQVSADLTSVAGELKRLDVEMAELLRRLRAVRREVAVRLASHQPLQSEAEKEEAAEDSVERTPAASAQTHNRRGSILHTLYRGMVLSLPIEAFFLLLCGIGFLLRPECEDECSSQPGLFSVRSPHGGNF